MTQMMIKSFPQGPPELIMVFTLASDGMTITIPTAEFDGEFGTIPMLYDCTVDWGDESSGTITSFNDPNRVHTYTLAGTYTVVIDGLFERIAFLGDTMSQWLYEVSQWGDTGFKSFSSVFQGCINFTITATDTPNLSGCWALFNTFNACTSLNSGLENWETSSITNMQRTFVQASAMNADISGWDVSNVTYMKEMFSAATSFNQDINGWDVSNVTNMRSMFAGCSVFNQDLNLWDLTNCTETAEMFNAAYLFNGDIDNWNVSAVTSAIGMFLNATAFNRDISGWDITSFINLTFFFQNAAAFNQDISGWDVSAITAFNGMMLGATSFSTANYDLLLNAWSLLTVQSGIFIVFESSYTITTSQAARDILTGAPNNWGITDGGGI